MPPRISANVCSIGLAAVAQRRVRPHDGIVAVPQDQCHGCPPADRCQILWRSAPAFALNDVVSVVSRGLSECASGRSSSFHRIDRMHQQRVVVAAPARHLHAFDRRQRRRIGAMHRIGAHAQRAGERHIHPRLEIRPRRKVVVGAPHRLARRLGPHLVPAGEVGAPLGIQCGERAIVLAQPDAHAGQRTRRQIEVPERRKIGDAGLVAQAVVQRIDSALCSRTVAISRSRIRCCHTGSAKLGSRHSDDVVIRVLPIAMLRLDEAPVHWRPGNQR